MKSLAIELGPLASGSTQSFSAPELRAIRSSACIASRRIALVDAAAALALFLCSPAACNLTGQAVTLDGTVESV